MNDRLTGIDTFVGAVDAGSFALAAERMGLSRSAVGKTIARLEHRLGTRLFHRTTRQQSLTEDGQAYYERCVRALAELDAAEATLASGRREPRGRLRVSVPLLFGRHCVAPVMMALGREYPKLQVEMSFSDRVVDMVEEGFDLAVRIGTLRDSATLAARRLGTQAMGICASPAYLERHGTPQNVEDFASHTAIVYGSNGQSAQWRLRDVDGQVREPAIGVRLRFDDVQVIADAAVAGHGLAWLPCWLMAPHLKTGALTLVMNSRRTVASDIHAVWPQTRYLPSKTRVAIDALVAQVPPLLAEPSPLESGSVA
ncbi:LysR family transcriptional regulator [Tahibacter soli]|jgi:DNA-binding transcriptional LysR family regulator|uniref:LysR family transcriptional regulator n=1 Tax=Tahibacter soli TaxID=2983605 RepID=A0A9X3YM39_9GAMM|nr:LysR family transcriptional regulator [Tahibacter soli]MDC8013233.1 LysR family transcriptional regulator [Tahibacter soli]